VAGPPAPRLGRLAVRERLRRALPALRALGFLAALALVGVIAITAVRDLPDRDLRWELLVPALAAITGWWLLLAGGWAILAGGGWSRTGVAQWCRTQVLRYLPGGIWAPVSRVAVVGGSALDRVSTVAAENVIALCAALAVGAVALAASGRWVWTPLALAAAAPMVLAHVVKSRTRVNPLRVRRATAGYLVAFAAYVVAAVLAQAAVSGWQDAFLVAGAAALAWAAGLVVVFAPSGLGARELAYVGLLEGALPAGDPAAGAVTLRLVTVVAELAVLLFVGRPSLRLHRHTSKDVDVPPTRKHERRPTCGS
jgi:glycosyltransferase 2 family protein